jgi:hypothetical protein
MCPSRTTCLPADCCFSELALTYTTKRLGLAQRGHNHWNLQKTKHNFSSTTMFRDENNCFLTWAVSNRLQTLGNGHLTLRMRELCSSYIPHPNQKFFHKSTDYKKAILSIICDLCCSCYNGYHFARRKENNF